MTEHTNRESAANTTAVLHQYKTLEARFDRAARLYDATYGPPSDTGRGNAWMGWMYARHQTVLRAVFPQGALLLDIGCGTGEDALALARAGYSVLGIDISPAMVRQAQTKAAVYGIQRGVSFRALAAGRLDQLDERGPFQGAFAGLGALNTEPDLPAVARELHTLLEPGQAFVATVMSRHCLFEILYNLRRFKPGQTLKRGPGWLETRAGSGGVIAPVRFYTPAEFAAPFLPYFTVESVEAFPLWLPPLHMHELYNANPARFQKLERRDEKMRARRGFRAWGDHFLMVLRHMPPAAAVPVSAPPSDEPPPAG